MRHLSLGSLAALAAATLAACSDTTGTAAQSVQLSFAAKPTTQSAFQSQSLSDPVTVTVGSNTLIINKAVVVLRDIKLERANATCASEGDDDRDQATSGADEHECDELKLGPMVVDLPLTANVSAPISAAIPAGSYHSIGFKLHKLGRDSADRAVLAANPTMNGASVRVEGTYNGTPFVYVTDRSASREIEFQPPLVVDATGTSVTINVDVSTWFKVNGEVVNPAQATPGTQLRESVDKNIKYSFRGYRDRDRDGREDH